MESDGYRGGGGSLGGSGLGGSGEAAKKNLIEKFADINLSAFDASHGKILLGSSFVHLFIR